MRSLVAAVVVVVLAATPLAAQTTDASQASQPPTDASQVSQPPAAAQTPAPPTPAPTAPDPKKNQPPALTHTGWATLLKDTGVDFVAFPRRRSTWVFLGLGAAGALATHPADDYVESHVVGSTTADRVFAVGKWVGSSYVQVGAGVGLWVVGRYVFAPAANEPRTNRYSEIGFDLIRAQIVSQVVAYGMKQSFRRDRPTGECCSFPSGHAASAFAAASVLERHFGNRGSWPAMAGATYVAVSRLVDDRHFLSDVVMGAGVGIASGWTVVGTRGRSGLTLQPVPVKGGMMIALMRLPTESLAPIR